MKLLALKKVQFLFFLNRPPLCFVSSYSFDFTIDVLSTFLQSVTLVSIGQLTRCQLSFASEIATVFLFFLYRPQLFFGSSYSLDFVTELHPPE